LEKEQTSTQLTICCSNTPVFQYSITPGKGLVIPGHCVAPAFSFYEPGALPRIDMAIFSHFRLHPNEQKRAGQVMKNFTKKT